MPTLFFLFMRNMLSFTLDNTNMLTVCVTNIECLKYKGSKLPIKYNLNVVLCQLFMIASDSQQLKQIPMMNQWVCITSIIH